MSLHCKGEVIIMNSKQLTRLIAAVCAAGMAVSLTACGNGAPEEKPSETTAGTAEVTTVNEETDFVEFTGVVTTEIPEEDKGMSIEKIAEDIVLNGSKISFPCAVKDLGAEYAFSFFNENSFTMLNNKKVYNAELSYNGEPNLIIGFMSENDGAKPEDGQIYYISVLPGASADALKICGIGMGTSKADVETVLGKIYTVTDHAGKAVSYSYGDYQSVDIIYDDNDCVMDYSIKYVTF